MYGLATGTVFKDVEVRESKAGKTFGKATIKSGSGDDTIFVRVIVFDGPQLAALRNLQSGDSIAIAHVLIPGGVGIGQELAWLRKFDSGIAS
jgi:hypothetical protein